MIDTEIRRDLVTSATIMLVDDEPTTIDVVEMLLRSEGYQKFIATTDPTRVLTMLGEQHPDVLLLNLLMPDVSGLEILESMRTDPVLRKIPVIILTSSTDTRAKRKALELGAADFLAKPVDPSELALRLQNTLLAKDYRFGEEPTRAGTRPTSSKRVSGESPPPVISRLDGMGPRFQTIIEKFLVRLRVRLAEMEQSWEAGDLEELASLAHWLKGAAGTVGFDAFTAPAQTLNALAREGKLEEVGASIRELLELAERIVVSSDSSA